VNEDPNARQAVPHLDIFVARAILLCDACPMGVDEQPACVGHDVSRLPFKATILQYRP
jgi:hypothetical protein